MHIIFISLTLVYLATRPDVEGFRDQDPKYKAFEFRVLWLLGDLNIKAFTAQH